MKRVETKCDDCKKLFVIVPKSKQDKLNIYGREQEVKIDYFRCPHCGAEYPILVRDSSLKTVTGKFDKDQVKHEAELMRLYKEKLTRQKDG